MPASSTNPLRRFKSSVRELRDRHQARHQPSGFGFLFADRSGYLPATHWDAVTAHGTLFLRRDVLQVIERHGPDNIQLRYALVFRDHQPVAALVTQIVTVTSAQLRSEKSARKEGGSRALLRRVLSPASRLATSRLNERMLVAGNLLSWGFHGLAFAPGEDRVPLWAGIAEALYRIRRAERLSGETNFVMVKDLTPAQNNPEILRRFSFRPLATEPNMVLEIQPRWKTYDDYLSALDAKYRRNSRDQLKKLAAAQCTVEPLSDLAPHAARIHELYLAVHHHAAVRLITLPESYLPALAGALGKDFQCSIVRQGETILGFVTCLRDGDTAIAYYIGFDRAAAAAGLPIYLRLLHATIGHAIGWGCKRLSLGRTALEPKAALGAKPEPMSVWLRLRVPMWNWMVRGLLHAIPHDEPPERNPFKVGSPEVKTT